MHPILNIAIRAVRKGGNIIIQNYDNQNFTKENSEKKKNFIQNVTNKTYRMINEIIHKSYPSHIILNKNTNLEFKNKNNTYWIVNELDGILNFINRLPHFCISIAVIVKGITEISVIYDPVRNDLFTAVKGQGSQLNGYRTRCTNANALESSTIAINLPYYKNNESLSYIEVYKKLFLCGFSFRCTGSSVLDLAYVSSGKIDCLFHFNLEPNNFIAGKLQLIESGCLVNNFQKSLEYNNFNTAKFASNPKFIRLMTEKISAYSNI
ncbi:inositol monophosphatase [Buchnera aphidicola (Muscaphis stroyani)]|uniref:Inositol-1-monophosphatase n=1 Tax=Buchnera aphidicola (Muscaphis stroyani) TaxID=1241869 RepID=A0A4D6Y4S2_9GAMM|nr:inositol monophosphatase family protein [Buchnera aphidicola]QCI24357.1 inositol monophosphatase [Buchnera aphidicola (Muscaphis stroyani)]